MRRIFAAALLATLAGCASTSSPEEDPVNVRLNDIDNRLGGVERVVQNKSLVEMAQRLDAQQNELRLLRGRIEELENSNEALRKQNRDLFADLDKRVQALQGGNAAVPGSAAGAAGAAGGVAGPAGAAAVQQQAAYDRAFDALKSANYPAAITGFGDFLARYPQAQLADNAQYWLGEAYYVTRDYPNAAAAFQSVLQRWPSSRKAPDALLKLGYTLYEQKRYPEARATLNDVAKRYPDTDAARLARERLARIPADAR
jgi:tol-pal system protein YbgF